MAIINYTEAFQTWNPSTTNIWEEKDLSSFIPATGDITAEIVIGTSGDVDINYSGGVRTPGSSLERLAILNFARDAGGYNTVTMHVQASGGKIENFAPSGVDFFLMGYWEGAKYIELIDNFLASGTNAWTNGNLNSFGVPSGVIAEIAASQSFGNQTQGFRSVGSSSDRRFLMDDGDNSATPDNYAFWSSPVQTSGNLATIQHYVAFASDWQPFQVFGYWEEPPGDYIDVYTDDAANPPNELTWDNVTVAGLPSGSIGSFLIGHQDNLNSRVVGIRESGSSLERKINGRKRQSRRCMISCHVNALDGNIETIAENVIGTNDHFALIGYWDNLNTFTPPTNVVATSGKVFDWFVKTSDYFPQLIGTFSGASSVNIQIWDVTDGQNTLVPILNNGCYTIGDTGRWGWSTSGLPLSQNASAQYFYVMTSNIAETFDGQFVMDVPEGAKWIHPNNQNDYLRQV